jgi:hypothetical protein
MADFHKRGLWLKGIARHLDDERISDILCNYANQMMGHKDNSRSSFLLGHQLELRDVTGRLLAPADLAPTPNENPSNGLNGELDEYSLR